MEKTKIFRQLCKCDPSKVTIGGYQRQVAVIPEFVTLYKNGENVKKEFISVDVCLISELLELWRMGIRTTGCCCGHNKDSAGAYIGVVDADITKMLNMGYENQPNPGDLSRIDSFIPKSLKDLNWQDYE